MNIPENYMTMAWAQRQCAKLTFPSPPDPDFRLLSGLTWALPIIQSFEPGESWRWCYVDQFFME